MKNKSLNDFKSDYFHSTFIRKSWTYKPINIFILYILLTMAISFWGPIEYFNFNKTIVAIYMMFFLVLFYFAYCLGVKHYPRKKIKFYSKLKLKKLFFILKICILITLLLEIISFLSSPFVKQDHTLVSIGQAYIDIYTGFVRNIGRSYSFFEIAYLLSGLVRQTAVILGFYYFRSFKKKWKIFIVLIILLIIFNKFVFFGTQKQIGDIFIYLIGITALKLNITKFSKKKILIVAFIIVAVFLFTYVQKSRIEALNQDVFSYNKIRIEHLRINTNNLFFKTLGYEWGFPFATVISSYLGGGYYGLSLCLQLPFKWTYGLGSSYAIAVFTNRFLGMPFFFENTYPIRMENVTGWPALSKWHSIFPWLASDFTFFGALLFLMVIAYIYSKSWIESYRFKNPISILLFCNLNIMLIFIPNNNQLMISPESLLAFVLLLFLWLTRHKKYNFR